MRIPWRRVMWAAVILVPVVAAGTILWLSTRDLSRYQARLTEQIRKVTGREIATRSKLAVKIGREPALVAEGVTLSNAP
jgi:AsmA family protein